MPKRTDIASILVLGSGPITIGQACEFDYAGTQACKVLRREGYRIILVNSNPATIMTDPEFAHSTYVEPLVPEILEKIVEREKPDALLPTVGGQTGLNLAVELAESGVLDRYGVRLIGASRQAIEIAEDRQKFKAAMQSVGLEVPVSGVVNSVADALELAKQIGYPVLVRPSFTLGGSGAGIARNTDELREATGRGLRASPVHQVLIEESVLGYKEFELEVMRDRADNFVVVCSIENLDPMGVHTGDSITVAPAQTLTDREYQRLRDAARRVMSAVGVETGGSNVQFAVHPENGRVVVIEMNPRVSRSSALASKATGFPIAKIAALLAVGYTLDEIPNDITQVTPASFEPSLDFPIAKIAALLAVGYTLDEIPNDITQVTPASFEPSLDYVVVKVPRWAFEKFPGADPVLGPQMKSVGEVMALGGTFREALQKALRGLEVGVSGLTPRARGGAGPNHTGSFSLSEIARPTAERIFMIADALRDGTTVDEIVQAAKIDPWFIEQLNSLVETERALATCSLSDLTVELLRRAKREGFSDSEIARLTNADEDAVRSRREEMEIRPVFVQVDTCAADLVVRRWKFGPCLSGWTLVQQNSKPTRRICTARTARREMKRHQALAARRSF
ncbi:MAG: carbamoyl-phosphate synthase large subunit [Chloroflexi bacterium]|nr:carbamoyl-phosphate synthase large subunit [Chloroflexota bacterium]